MRIHLSATILIIVFTVCNSSLFAQKTKTTAQPASATASSIELYQKMRVQALELGDLETASSAIQAILILDPAADTLRDSLCHLFFLRRMYVSAFKLGNEVLEKRPQNPMVLELVAVSAQSLGDGKTALPFYEKLYAITKNHYHLYEIASLEYQMGRFVESDQKMMKLAIDPALDKEGFSLNDSKGAQEVSLSAAAYNVAGAIALDMGKIDVAIDRFKKAIDKVPDFRLAKANLDIAMKKAIEK